MKYKAPVFGLILFCCGCQPATDTPPASELVPSVQGASLTEEEKREAIHAVAGLAIAQGLEVSLFASEPMLVNPTNIDIDFRGRIWVCEGINYRPNRNPQNPVREEMERILILEDTDGDGQADSRKVFYEGHDINAALGIAVLGNKVIVSASPYVLLLTDTDGDDIADERKVLFQGVGGEQHDHAVHAFVFGPDGKLYFNYGNEGNQLRDGNGNLVVDVAGNQVIADGNPYRQGMVFRMDEDGSNLEVLGHNFRNNYELAIDSYGTLWQSDNDDDGNEAVRINYVMEFGNYGFRDEMTGANWRERRTGWHDEVPLRHWHLRDPGVVPNLLQTGAGSPTGIVIYEADLLPTVFQGEMIHADAGPNVVRSYPVARSGAGYTAEIVDILKGVTDQWFRPSDVAIAPDGSLIIADWYDPGVGGHHVGDLSRGRLFRVAPPGTDYVVPELDLGSIEGAVEALKSPNMATRYLAWQMLHGAGLEAEEALRNVFENDTNPRYRSRALWLLGKIPGRAERYVEEALRDENEDIRITGIRLARQEVSELMPILQVLSSDPSPQIRREVAIALRYRSGPAAAELWADLATRHDGADRWYLEALGIAAEGKWDSFFSAWLQRNQEDWDTPAGRDIVWRARTNDAMPMLVSTILDAATPEQERLRYFRAFDFHRDEGAKALLLPTLLAHEGDNRLQVTSLALKHLANDEALQQPMVQEALNWAVQAARGTRLHLDLVERFDIDSEGDALFDLALSNGEEELGKDALSLLLSIEGTERLKGAILTDQHGGSEVLIPLLVDSGSSAGRQVLEELFLDDTVDMNLRTVAFNAYGTGWQGENGILSLLEAGTFPEVFNAPAASILFSSSDSRRRLRAEAFFDPPADISGEPLPAIEDLVRREGDTSLGQTIYTAQCGICHVVNGEGIDFGPALTNIGAKLPREALYQSILFPSGGISFGYEGVEVIMQDGNMAAGYVLSETDSELSVRLAGGVTQAFDKAGIAELREMDQSLMPELGPAMGADDLVNLVAYLETLK